MLDPDAKSLPAMTKAFQIKVVKTSSPDNLPYGDPGAPRDGSGPGLTNMTPIASRRLSGNAGPWTQPSRGPFQHYGKGPR